ncbi:TetR/AcrR family transcriptional regulator [Bacillus horti]|uniref:AcrR family transcriptional regulator n=1 Tax=Caldalkalibacillus horti TaxID=77523 RepID=A0ABT9VYX4_9BACI|nr:helix-turn-helix domain-containing protein [Bacillus horti]MDQ0166192.1 AcrR family transcriptional regulator [Bacillus horti]
MKEWIPIPGTSKDTLIKAALEEFSSKGYKGVNITELAEKAKMTTGAVYHHFGSKAKLYEVVRAEMEQRIVDRMEGAASLFDQKDQALKAALLTGLAFVVKQDICKLIGEETPTKRKDKIEIFLGELSEDTKGLPIEIILMSSWRAILNAISNQEISPEQAKGLIEWVFEKGIY